MANPYAHMDMLGGALAGIPAAYMQGQKQAAQQQLTQEKINNLRLDAQQKQQELSEPDEDNKDFYKNVSMASHYASTGNFDQANAVMGSIGKSYPQLQGTWGKDENGAVTFTHTPKDAKGNAIGEESTSVVTPEQLHGLSTDPASALKEMEATHKATMAEQKGEREQQRIDLMKDKSLAQIQHWGNQEDIAKQRLDAYIQNAKDKTKAKDRSTSWIQNVEYRAKSLKARNNSLSNEEAIEQAMDMIPAPGTASTYAFSKVQDVKVLDKRMDELRKYHGGRTPETDSDDYPEYKAMETRRNELQKNNARANTAPVRSSAPASKTTTISSQAEYEKLPKGTKFVWNGKEYTKG